jgi:hypothetical protein
LKVAVIIRKIKEPTEWVNSMVMVTKSDGNLEVCLDPRDLNSNIQREYYQLPTMKEILSRVANAQYL